MTTLIPTHKVPRTAAIFALVTQAYMYTCPSCGVKRRHWVGYLSEKTREPYTYVCLHCGQASIREELTPYYTIRVAVRTIQEARVVRNITHNRPGLWSGVEILQSDGSIHLQFGSHNDALANTVTNALRSAGFRATWEERAAA